MKTLLFCLTLMFAAAAPAAPAAAPLPGDSVYQLPVVLLDADGRHQSWHLRRGRPQLVSMFYTSCRYVCPLIIDSLQGIDHALSDDERAALDVLVISMDPARDDVAALRSVADKRHLDRRRWTLAAPTPADVRAIAGVLGIRYRQLADGDFNHSSALILLDADGRVVARTEALGTTPDPAFLAAVQQALPAPR